MGSAPHHGGEAPAVGHDVHEDAEGPLQGRLGDEEAREEERRKPAGRPSGFVLRTSEGFVLRTSEGGGGVAK